MPRPGSPPSRKRPIHDRAYRARKKALLEATLAENEKLKIRIAELEAALATRSGPPAFTPRTLTPAN